METDKGDCNHARIMFIILMAVSTISITGCATYNGKYAAVKSTIIPIPKGEGRIVFYRPSAFYGGGMRPGILLNGKRVGKSRPGTIFYVDVQPGAYNVTIPTSLYGGERVITFAVSKKETVYVKNYMGGSAFGGRTNMKVVNPSQAVTEIGELYYMADPF